MNFKKEMTGFYMHSVCLPEKVTEHFNDLVGKHLEFRCSSGNAWHVGLIGSGDKLVLQHGWSEFASSNNILQNDLLLFKLVNGSTFEVRIFDASGQEKEDFEREVDGAKAQESIMIHSSRKRSSNQDCDDSLPSTKRLKREFYTVWLEEENSSFKEVQRLHSQNKKESLEGEGTYEVSVVDKADRQEEGQLEAKNNDLLQSEHPSPEFQLLGNGQNETTIPKNFSVKHLQQGSQTCLLRLPEKENTWSVRCYVSLDGKQYRSRIRGNSCSKFFKDNNMQEGDICLFELAKTAHQIAFIVHVSRAT